MKFNFPFHKFYIGELFVVFCFIFTINNYIGNSEQTINADGIGYYDYLPSAFIHNDLNRHQDTSVSLDRINNLGVYIDYEGYKLNKYACGTALLQSPFFFGTLWTSDLEGTANDGYQPQFHRAIYYAALFYIFLSLILIRGLLRLYDTPRLTIFACQLLMVLATTITVYAGLHASFSHISSLFAITAFLYFVKRFFVSDENRWIVLASVALGFIYLIRPTNIIVLLFVPFLADNFNHFKTTFLGFFKSYKRLIISIVIVFAVCFIQSIFWFCQTGEFFLYPYQGEGFKFSEPHFIDILFSYKRGLFVYTPFLFIVLISSFILIKTRRYQFICWIAFFLFITYFLSSWWSWTFGSGFGLRAYVDFYPLFILVFALALREMSKAFKTVVITLSLVCIPLNVIQSYQYKMYILDWTNMDKTKYWKVFLETDKRYVGWFFKSTINESNYGDSSQFTIPSKKVPKHTYQHLVKFSPNDLEQLSEAKAIRLELFDSFNDKESKRIGIIVKDSNGELLVWDERPAFQYGDIYDSGKRAGYFDYQLPIGKTVPVDSLIISLISDNEAASISDLKVTVFH